MLSLFTGLPGAGKTLNLIKYVLEHKPYQGRPVYYYGINGLNIDGWTELTEDQVHVWYNIKSHFALSEDVSPLLVIDEVQKIWRQRGNSSKVPNDVQQLEQHRHIGIDILMTCQRPMQIDHDVRGLVQQHWHYDRVASLKTGRVYKFERCISDPYKDKYLAVSTERYKIDKKYFDCYKSAEVHTHGSRIPKKLYYAVGLIVICITFIGYAYKVVINDRSERNYIQPPDIVKQPVNNTQLVVTDGYLQKFVSRYPEIPFSQPFYDELISPESYPYLAGCQNFKINDVDNCTCSSLQGNKINIPQDYCLSFLEHGQHDFTLPDSEILSAMNKYLPTGDPCCGSGDSNSEEENK